MKKFFRAVFILILILASLLLGIRVYQQCRVKIISSKVYEVPQNYEELPVENIIVDYVFDPNDLNAYAGFVDYIFIGKVEEVTGITYTDVELIYHDFPIAKIDGYPQTHYKITVLENIKGSLVKDITLTQGSGPAIGGKRMHLVAGQLMKGNDVHIFMAYTKDDGELHIGDAAGAVKLGSLQNAEEYSELRKENQATETVQKYIEAYKNQDESHRYRERRLCIYDSSK